MELLYTQVSKDGKRYTDIYVAWRTDKKVYAVRVRPQFSGDMRLLLSQAVWVEDVETIQKYV